MSNEIDNAVELAFKALGIPLDASDKSISMSTQLDVDVWVSGYRAAKSEQSSLPMRHDDVIEEMEEKFSPPDSDDICWQTGAEAFTRKEVYYLLYIQRAMISNDLKTYAGNELTENIYAVLNHPRIPKY